MQEWLRAACKRAAADDSLDLPDGLTAADWACVREQVGGGASGLRLRHWNHHRFAAYTLALPAASIPWYAHAPAVPPPAGGVHTRLHLPARLTQPVPPPVLSTGLARI